MIIRDYTITTILLMLLKNLAKLTFFLLKGKPVGQEITWNYMFEVTYCRRIILIFSLLEERQ